MFEFGKQWIISIISIDKVFWLSNKEFVSESHLLKRKLEIIDTLI